MEIGRASVRLAFGVLFVLSSLVGLAAPAGAEEPSDTADSGCLASIMYVTPVPAGAGEPWSLPLLRGQPDPDHLRRECAEVGSHPELRQPLWHGPVWGIPSLGSFV